VFTESLPGNRHTRHSINKEIYTICVVFPLLCPTPVCTTWRTGFLCLLLTIVLSSAAGRTQRRTDIYIYIYIYTYDSQISSQECLTWLCEEESNVHTYWRNLSDWYYYHHSSIGNFIRIIPEICSINHYYYRSNLQQMDAPSLRLSWTSCMTFESMLVYQVLFHNILF
jgi:hypothetical protein